MKQECPHPHRVTVLTLDLSKPYECFEKAKDLNLKELDYLYNNGGVSQLSLFTETDFDTVEQIINTNTLGQIFLIKALLPALKESRGKIVNICAIAGKMGMTMRSIVSASKSALAGFSNALRAEVKPYGVSVFTMYPDHVKTDIAKNACSGVFGRAEPGDDHERRGGEVSGGECEEGWGDHAGQRVAVQKFGQRIWQGAPSRKYPVRGPLRRCSHRRNAL